MRPTLLLLLMSCATVAEVAGLSGVQLAGVRYQLDWDLTEVSQAPGGGWSAVSDLGWTWEVDDGALTVWQASLVPCAQQVARAGLITSAFAGHSGDVDPSTTETALVERLRAPTAATLDIITFDAAEYCGAHLAVGAAKADSLGVDELPQMLGVSLWMVGRAVAPDGQARPFELRTSWSHGLKVDLPPSDVGRVVGAEVHAHRALGRLWDGVDPDVMSEAERDWRVLENLIASTTLEAHYMPVSALGESAHDHSHGP